jgi:hypothetical protein
MVKQPFAKSTSMRGNPIYKGANKNSSAIGNYQYTTVLELVQSKADAKQLYDQTVALKLGEGFTARPDLAASYKAGFPQNVEVWVGQQSGNLYYIEYYNDHNVAPPWIVGTDAGGAGS